jgi:hypothetical protein
VGPFSDYIIFADESGDHGLATIDPQFPVFSLVFCIFEKSVYQNEVEPAVRAFKYRWFGHDAVILHERDIRKQLPPFDFLRHNREVRERFFEELNVLMAGVTMEVYASVIDKEKLRSRYNNPWSPYEVGMHFGLERCCSRLLFHKQKETTVHVLFESRGSGEDNSLELEFRRITAGEAQWGWKRVDFSKLRMEAKFVAKAANMAGHQITDLIARPMALRALRPDQENRAYDLIRERVNQLKVFP